MIRGSCLCGGVRFEIRKLSGPFELCHCSRCRKVSGSMFAAMVGVDRDDFELVSGSELVDSYEAPILERPPPYKITFCRRCGSPVPNPGSEDESGPAEAWFEVPAGLLDDDPVLRPDKHIMVDHKAPWCEIEDSLPQLDRQALFELRRASRTGPTRPGGA